MNIYWQTTHGLVSLKNPLFLGIVNATPDSFSDGNLYLEPSEALKRASYLIDQGASVIDVGAESTRPGATAITCEDEWDRLEPVLKLLIHKLPKIPISLDTRNASVAIRGLELGVSIINDISGFQDSNLLKAVIDSNCGLIAMRSTIEAGAIIMPPYNQTDTHQPNKAIQELDIIKRRLLNNNISYERILLDPGFGFGTSFNGDLAIWNAMSMIPKKINWPVERFCIGLSRKRFLSYKAGNKAIPPIERDDLTLQAHRELISLNYRVFRTHAAMS